MTTIHKLTLRNNNDDDYVWVLLFTGKPSVTAIIEACEAVGLVDAVSDFTDTSEAGARDFLAALATEAIKTTISHTLDGWDMELYPERAFPPVAKAEVPA